MPHGIWCQLLPCELNYFQKHDDVIKWKHFPRYWPLVRGIHQWPVNSPHKGHWRGVLMFSLICAWTNDWVNNRDGGDSRRHHAHYDITVMKHKYYIWFSIIFPQWGVVDSSSHSSIKRACYSKTQQHWCFINCLNVVIQIRKWCLFARVVMVRLFLIQNIYLRLRLIWHRCTKISNIIVRVSFYDILVPWILCHVCLNAHKPGIKSNE